MSHQSPHDQKPKDEQDQDEELEGEEQDVERAELPRRRVTLSLSIEADDLTGACDAGAPRCVLRIRPRHPLPLPLAAWALHQLLRRAFVSLQPALRQLREAEAQGQRAAATLAPPAYRGQAFHPHSETLDRLEAVVGAIKQPREGEHAGAARRPQRCQRQPRADGRQHADRPRRAGSCRAGVNDA